MLRIKNKRHFSLLLHFPNVKFSASRSLFDRNLAQLQLHKKLSANIDSQVEFSDITDNPLYKTKDIYHHNIKLSEYVNNGKLREATEVFAKIRNATNTNIRADAISYTTMINGYIKFNQIEKAEELFFEMRERNIPIRVVTYSSMLAGYFKTKKFDRADILYQDMKKNKISPNLITYSILIKGYFEKKNSHEATQLFNELKRKNIELDTIFYNLMIDGYIKHGKYLEAEKIFKLMEKSNFNPDIVTFSSMLRGMLMNKKLNQAKEFFDKIPEKNNIVLYATLIHGFIEANDLQRALFYFQEMKDKKMEPNIVIYTSILSGYYNNKDFALASKFYEEMIQKGMKPTVVTYSTIIDGLINNRQLQKAYETIFQMKNENLTANLTDYCKLIESYLQFQNKSKITKLFDAIVHENLVTFNITIFNKMISNAIKKGNIDGGLFIFNEMKRCKITPDHFTYSSILNGLNKNHFSIAKQIFNDMLIQGNEITPNLNNFNIILHGYISNNDLHGAKQLFETMKKCKINPDVITCTTFVNGLLHNVKFISLKQFMYSMQKEYNIQFPILLFNKIISSCVKNSKFDLAQYFYDSLKKYHSPDIYTYATMIDCYFKQNNDAKAMRFYNEMKLDKIYPNSVIFITVIDGFSRCGYMDSALRYFREMELLCSPPVGAYNLILSGLLKLGKIDRALGFYNEMRTSNTQPDNLIYSTMISGLRQYPQIYSQTSQFENICKDFCATIDESISSKFPITLKNDFISLQTIK